MTASTSQRLRTEIPTADFVVMVGALVAGLAAASIAEPVLWYLTPVVVGCLLIASQHGTAKPAESDMSEQLRAKLAATLEQLPTGEIRALFSNAVTAALPVFTRRMRRLQDIRDVRTSVVELLESAADVAVDAARLDSTLRHGLTLQRDPSIRETAMKAREQHARQLADVSTTLDALVASGISRGTPESERVAELVTAIQAETTARATAWREIDSLLS